MSDDWQSVTPTGGANDWQSAGPPKPAPNSFIDAARSIPGGFAQGVASVAGMPGDVGHLEQEGIQYLADKAGVGSPVKSGLDWWNSHIANYITPTSDTINKVVSAPTGGYYQPQTTAGHYAQTIASFAPAAFGGEASIPARVARVVLPAVGSEAAGEATAGTDLEPYARVAGAVAGGGLTAAGKPIIRSINKLASNVGADFLDPTVEAQSKLTSAFNADGGADAAGPKLTSFANSGASGPALIDVSGNNTRRLVRAAAASDGPGQNAALSYADKIRANLQDNVIDHANAMAPYTSTADDYANNLAMLQSKNATEDYGGPDGPYAQPAAVTPQMVSALQGPEGQRAINRAFATASANRDVQQMGELQDLKSVAAAQSGGTDPITGKFQNLNDALSNLSAGSLDRVRIAMRELGGQYAAKGARGIAAGYKGRVSDIDTALDQTPGLTDARAAYRGTQAQIDAVPIGQSALNLPADDYASQIASLSQISPDARTAAAVGHRQAIIDAVSKPAQGQTGILNRISSSNQQTDNLSTSFGPDAGSKFQTAVGNEVDRLRNANFISPNSGSQTDLRNADRSLVDLPDIPRSATGFVLGLIDKIRNGATLTAAERAEIVRLGTSEPNLQAIATRTSTPAFVNRIAAPVALSAPTNQPSP